MQEAASEHTKIQSSVGAERLPVGSEALPEAG